MKCMSQQSVRRSARLSCTYTVAAVLGLVVPHAARGIDKHWFAGNGLWNNNANWLPAGVPVDDSDIFIGSIPGVQNSTVYMGNGIESFLPASLELSNGMTLDMNGSSLQASPVDILGDGTRLICRPAADFFDFSGIVYIGTGAQLELVDDALLDLLWGSWNHGLLSGTGGIYSYAGFRNDGVIKPGNNGGLWLESTAGPVDLDGTSGDGHLQLDMPFSQLLILTGLADPFSGQLTMSPGALLTIEVFGGWEADAGAKFDILGTNNPAAAALIDGDLMSFGGELNVGVNQAHLRVLADATLQPNPDVNIAPGGWLEFDGETIINGGQYTLGQGAKLEFDGATVQGGAFTTPSLNPADGFVSFMGTTAWGGTISVNGVARQTGNTAHTTGTTVINAANNVFDMDGPAGNVLWAIGHNVTVNASQIDTEPGAPNQFDGIINIGGGLVPRLTINLTNPAASWTMNGVMILEGETVLYETRVAGSPMIVNGEFSLDAGKVNITADTTFSALPGANVTIAPDSVLRMMADTFVGGAADFFSSGTLQNGPTGAMTLDDGVQLGEIGLVNEGHLFIRRADTADLAGFASVDRFTNQSGATWQVRVGGYTLGQDFDHIAVTDGAATLNGNLQIALFDAGGVPFNPQVGDEFIILTAVGGVNGNIVVDPTACIGGNSYYWSVLYGPNDVSVRLDSISGMPGDMNCDCRVNGLDIQLFVDAVMDPDTYTTTYPDCDILHGDTNGDGSVDFDDWATFAALLLSAP